MPPASVARLVVDTADDLGYVACSLHWLPLQLRYRMLCASATACLELGPAMVTAWMRLAIHGSGDLVPAPTPSRYIERHSAAAWAVQALRHAVVTLDRLADLVSFKVVRRCTCSGVGSSLVDCTLNARPLVGAGSQARGWPNQFIFCQGWPTAAQSSRFCCMPPKLTSHFQLPAALLCMQIDKDGGQRGTLGSLLRATCATDAKLLPALAFLGDASKLCTLHHSGK